MTPRQRSVSTAFGVVLLFALPLLPEILGSRVLIFRDAQITHWPWRRVAMAALDSGRVPFVNEAASGTQPLLANPNAVLLYPTVLLERLLPAASAFNLHYLLHVLWAFLGARLLASRLGVSPPSALFAGAAYAFSGMMLSYGSAFFNSSAAAAWLPWCAAAALAVGRADSWRAGIRASAATGLAFGLQLLAGEPAISLLTGGFAAFLCLVDVVAVAAASGAKSTAASGAKTTAAEKWGKALLARAGVLAGGGVAAAAVAGAFAAALLLPLRAVFPLTYRGQHLYSESAFGAAPFEPWRAIEWLFPRFSGDPSAIGSGAGWLAMENRQLVYIWCVTLGVLPLLVLLVGAVSRGFWRRTTVGLAGAAAAGWLVSLGLSLPFARALFSIELFRRLRYPIKFYLISTICVSLLAGFAADRLRPARRSRAAMLLLLLVLGVYGAGFAAAGPGGSLDGWVSSRTADGALPSAPALAVFRGSMRSDAVLGAATAILLAAILAARRPSQPGHVLALLCAALALPWGLPLFVSASAKDLSRPPALRSSIRGPGRLYASPRMPAPDFAMLEKNRSGLTRFDKVARALTEELVPATGQPFGISYVFDHDPDGSYGWYNRLANEAADASPPAERSRMLRAFGARWALAGEEEEFPLFHPVTGVVVAGRHLVLHGIDAPLADIRFASREHRRASLSGAIKLVRSETFDPETDVVLPGRDDRDADGPAVAATLALGELSPERAAGIVEAPSPGWVVLSRTHFPSWRGRVDGAPARVLVANARDLAIAVPAGRHAFELAWDRSPFHRGVVLQGAALLAALAAAAITSIASSTRTRSLGNDLLPAPPTLEEDP